MKLFGNREKPVDPTPLFGANMVDRAPTSEGSPEQQARVAELGKIAREGLVDSDNLLLQAGVMRGKQAEAAQNTALAELPPVAPAEGETSTLEVAPDAAQPPEQPVDPTPTTHV